MSATPTGTGPAPEVGTMARDTARDRVGRVMDLHGSLVYLRPPEGGREWEADVGTVQPVPTSEALSPQVAEENRRSRGGL